MPTITFYHRLSTPLEAALPKLLEKAHGAGMRVLVKADTAERVDALNTLLWTYAPDSFLPHGSAADGFAEQQPIYLTTDDENPNQARCLVLIEGVTSSLIADMERTLYLFDGQDDNAVQTARAFWQTCKAQGWQPTYLKQNSHGGWDKAA